MALKLQSRGRSELALVGLVETQLLFMTPNYASSKNFCFVISVDLLKRSHMFIRRELITVF